MQRAVFLACLLAVCFGTAQAQGSYPNFVAALSQPNFSSLKQVVTSLNLASTFANPALKVTVFVPTNAAFTAAQKATGITAAQLAGLKSVAQQVVYYHIVKEVVSAPLPNKALPTFVAGKTLQGQGMSVKDTVGGVAKIVAPNTKCGQGLAHGIDRVLTFIPLNAIKGH